jgi:DNA-binding CsgD family transcriptional regulator
LKELEWLQQWTELVSTADTLAEFGRKLVHSNISAPTAVGAHVFLLDSKGEFSLAGGYGLNPFGTQKFSAWDSHLLADAIQTRKLAHQQVEYEDRALHCYAIAVLKGEEPLGVAVFTQGDVAKEELSQDTNSAMSQVLGIWVQSLGLTGEWRSSGNGNGNGGAKNGEAHPEDLTERQMTILDLMSRGMTNAEIAQELILSESSIRQETVRIYRALGVGSRTEATKRAVHMGILRAPAQG